MTIFVAKKLKTLRNQENIAFFCNYREKMPRARNRFLQDGNAAGAAQNATGSATLL
jgi:hypothetical protein